MTDSIGKVFEQNFSEGGRGMKYRKKPVVIDAQSDE